MVRILKDMGRGRHTVVSKDTRELMWLKLRKGDGAL